MEHIPTLQDIFESPCEWGCSSQLYITPMHMYVYLHQYEVKLLIHTLNVIFDSVPLQNNYAESTKSNILQEKCSSLIWNGETRYSDSRYTDTSGCIYIPPRDMNADKGILFSIRDHNTIVSVVFKTNVIKIYVTSDASIISGIKGVGNVLINFGELGDIRSHLIEFSEICQDGDIFHRTIQNCLEMNLLL